MIHQETHLQQHRFLDQKYDAVIVVVLECEILKLYYIRGRCIKMVTIDISLERNEYAAGETAKGTLIISEDKDLSPKF
jgi:hypothetical protein